MNTATGEVDKVIPGKRVVVKLSEGLRQPFSYESDDPPEGVVTVDLDARKVMQ